MATEEGVTVGGIDFTTLSLFCRWNLVLSGGQGRDFSGADDMKGTELAGSRFCVVPA